MMNFARKAICRLATETRGAEIAEAAAVLPLMFMMLLGIFWFGQAFSIYGAITRAAQEGARAGSLPYCVTCNGSNTPTQNALNAVQATLLASNLDPNQAIAPSPAPTLYSCSDSTSAIACSGNSHFCVQSPILITDSLGATGLCGLSVSFQYPYRFWLPFASINNQTIMISASARVRMENR
ncbi:MAG: TadE/TadG family type IV pilus assembly protein [Candidatus Sulfotelmatobacter sp.]